MRFISVDQSLSHAAYCIWEDGEIIHRGVIRTGDVNAKQKKKGVAVIFVGEDLDVLIELCDRIMVIGSGAVTGIVDGRTATKEEIGLLMTKSKAGDSND